MSAPGSTVPEVPSASAGADDPRMPVVSTTAAVQLSVLDDRFPGIEIVRPATEFRLLVEVAVKQDHVVGTTGNIDKQHRRASLDPHHLDPHAPDRLLAAPAFEYRDCLVHVAVLLPVRVESR